MKNSAPKTRAFGQAFALRPIAYSVMLACCSGALANPVGPKVAAGAAAFQPNGKTLTITNAPGTIINWQSFSIGAGELTRFNQRSASSAVLNRVVGADGSSILGALTSNGRVFLVNPHGIVFGAGARIDTAGFIASTLNIADKDFLQGKFKFEGGGNGVLRNERGAEIRASGDIVLVGPVVENAGLIRSENGAVLLAAGRSVTITSPDAQGVKFELQAPDDTALNLGTIEASGAASMLAGTLRHSGDIRATTASVEGARVVLKAQKDATVDAGASVSANGAHGGSIAVQSGDTTIVSGRLEAMGSAGPGGKVEILGRRVGIFEGGSVDASGTTGGGTILVGGDFQGTNPDVPNASQTIVASGATLHADAIDSGDGGKVIVWADDATRFQGAISARGGAQSGDGGFVEVSGKKFLAFRGTVDTRALRGKTGTLLLDPTTQKFVADDSATENTEFKDQRFEQSGTEPAISEITVGSLRTALTMSDVFVSTQSSGSGDGDIDFEAEFDFNGIGMGRNLWLFADRDVNIKQRIHDGMAGGDSLSLIIKTGRDTNVSADVNLAGGMFDAARDGNRVVNMTSGTPKIVTSQFKAGTLNISDVAAELRSTTPPIIGAVNLTSGSLDVTGGVLPRLDMSGGTLTNSQGDLEITGPFNATGGTILANGTSSLVTRGPTKIGTAATPSTVSTERNWRNMGLLDLDTGSIDLQSGVTFTNAFGPDSVFNLNSVSFTPFGTNAGSMLVNESIFNKNSTVPSNIHGVFTNVEGGALNVRAGNLRFIQALSQGGTIEVFATAMLSTTGVNLVNQPAGVVGGAGTIDLEGGILINNGRVRPGPLNEPVSGTLTILGDLVSNDPTSFIDIELRGAPAGGNFDVLQVSGTASLGGTLVISTPPGMSPPDDYVATAGHNFQVLTAGSLASSAFSLVDKRFGNGLVDGMPTYNYASSPQTVTLQITTAPVSTWTGGGGNTNWFDPMNWDAGGVPGPDSTVQIPNMPGNVVINVPAGMDAVADRIDFSNERIVVEGSLALRNRSSIMGNPDGALALQGNMASTAKLMGTARVTANNLFMVGGEVESPNGLIVVTPGLTTLGDTITPGDPVTPAFQPNTVSGRLTVDRFDMQNPGTLVVTPDGTLVFRGTELKNIGGGTQNTIANAGTIRFEGGASPTLLGVQIANTGRLELVNGVDLIAAGGMNAFNNGGSGRVIVSRTTPPSAPPIDSRFELAQFVSAGAEVEARDGTTVTYASGINTFGDARMTGPGTHKVVSGQSVFAGTINSSNLSLEGGTFTGMALLGGNTAWTGGTVLGTFTISEGSRLDIGGSPTSERVLDGGSIANLGTVNITSGGNILRNGAVIENGNSGQFGRLNFAGAGALALEDTSALNNRYHALIDLTPTSSSTAPIGAGGMGSVLNEGILQKSAGSAPTQTVDVPYRNTGIVTIDEGTLALPRPGGSPDSGYYGMADGATLDLSGGNRVFAIDLSTSDEGTIKLVGGTLDARNGVLPGVMLGGDATLNQTTPGDLTILGAFDVGNATIGAPADPGDRLVTQGTTTVTGIVTVGRNWTNESILDINSGRVSPVSAPNLFFRNEDTVNIRTADPNPFSVTTADIINADTINFMRTSAGPGDFDHPFTNLAGASLNVRSGALQFKGPVTHNGAIVIGTGAILATLGNNLTNPAGARIAGDGTVDLSSNGTFGTLSSSGNLRPGSGPGIFTGGGALPGTLDIIGDLSLDSAVIDGLGMVTVTGMTTVSGTSNIASGLETRGFTMNGGSLAIGAGGVLNFIGFGTKTIAGATTTVTNNGTATLTGGMDLILNDGAQFTNNNIFNIAGTTSTTNNRGIRSTAGAAPTFTNSSTGSLAKVFGVRNSVIGGGPNPFNFVNDGGTLDVQTIGALEYAGTNTFGDGTRFIGLGRNVVTGGGTFNGAMTSNGLTLESGTYTSTAGASFGGTTTWTGGNMTGAFTVPAAATLNVAGGGATTVAATASLVNNGTTNFAAAQTINAPFSNAGTVNINGGTLSLGGDGTDTGAYVFAPGTVLDLTGGTRNFNGPIALAGTGKLRSFATLNLNAPLTLAAIAFDMNGGVLTDAAGLTLNGEFNWSAGTITGGGVLTTGAAAATTVSGTATLSGKLWDNFGALALNGAGQIVLEGSDTVAATTFVNRGTGVITDTSTNALPITTATSKANKAFANAGTFNKNAGSAATQTLDVPMTNTGTVNVRTGTLVANGFPTNNGVIDLEAGTTLSTAGAPFTNGPIGSITGNGTILSPTFTNNGSVGPGDSPGTLTVSGDYVQGPTGTLVIELGGAIAGTDYDVMNVSGNATLDGALAIFVSPGQTIAAGSNFDFMTYASRTGDFTTFAVPPGQTLQVAPGPTGYRVSALTPPIDVLTEVTRIGQRDAVVLASRGPDNILVPDQQQQTSEEERRSLGDCR